MAITITKDSATISTTEYFLASDSTTATYQTSKVVLDLFLDLSAMQAGDTFVLKLYEKVNAGTARVYSSTTYTDAQTIPNKRIECGVVGEGWECSLIKTGGTDRSIAWSLRTVA